MSIFDFTKEIINSFEFQGETIFVKAMSSGDWAKYTNIIASKDSGCFIRTQVMGLAYTVCDPQGNLEDQNGDRFKLMPAEILDELFEAAAEFNGIGAMNSKIQQRMIGELEKLEAMSKERKKK